MQDILSILPGYSVHGGGVVVFNPSKLAYLVIFILLFGSLSGCVVYSSNTSSAATAVGPKKSMMSRGLLITVDGPLVEDATVDLSLRMSAKNQPVLARRIITTLEHARNDKNIDLIVLNLSQMLGGSLATITDVHQALQETKKAGKTIYAYSESYQMSSFLLASVADKIWIDPFGDVEIDGLALDFPFFKRAMEKYGIDAYITRAGRYKSAVEPLMQYSMSPLVREETSKILRQQWLTYVSLLKQSKRFANINVENYVASRPQLLVDAKGDAAALAVKEKLVDSINTSAEFQEILKNEGYEHLENYQNYLRQSSVTQQARNTTTPYVTVLYAVGEIARTGTDGRTLDAEALVASIKIATENPRTKALVLRVESPGGEVFASEMIARAIEKAKEKIPVIISMAGVAASGGYWFSLAGTEIWAEQATLTGSIGVFSVLLSANRFLREHGVDFESIRTHPQAGMPDSYWSPVPNVAQGEMLQSNVEFIYNQFLKRVISSGRAKNIMEADSLAQGKVYTGKEAMRLGLVDKVGTLEDALKRAAEVADLREYVVVVYKPPQSLLSRIFSLLKEPGRLLAKGKLADLGAPTAYIDRESGVYALSGFVVVLP